MFHAQMLTEPGRNKWPHFACQFGELRSENPEKVTVSGESLSILALFFQIGNIPFLSSPNWHAK
jgi:hypothetical protein